MTLLQSNSQNISHDSSQLPQFIDTHTHLDYEYPFTVQEHLDRAAAAGVGGVITIGAARERWALVSEYATTLPNVWYTVGIHPHDAVDWSDDIEKQIRIHAANPGCVALGEMGLDYHYDHSPRAKQIEVCRTQMALAVELGKPVVIHSRLGEDDLLKLLDSHVKSWYDRWPQRPPGVIHCFSGTPEFAQECLRLGFYLSFSGILTFKKAEEVRQSAALAPLDRILVETDSPYLAPQPYRGQQNQSAYMIETCRVLSQIKSIDMETLSKVTLENTRALFGVNIIN